MLNLRKQLAPRHAVALKFIGHDHARHVIKALQQASEKPFGRLAISPWLNEDVENDAVLIHGTPQIMLRALDPDQHLVHVPLVPGPWSAASQAVCEGLAKLLAPPTNRLIRDDSTAFSQKQLNVPQTEAEHMIQPDRMADDLGRKAMAVVRIGRGFHAASLAGLQPAGQTRLPGYRDNATRAPTGKLMITMLGAIAEFERGLLLERQREGVAKAKADGKYRGRKPTARAKAAEVLRLSGEGLQRTEIARRLEIGVASVYRILTNAKNGVGERKVAA